jgi:hypothetical protein
MSLPIDDPRGLWMAAHFAPGAVTLRAHLVGKPRLPPIPPMTLAKGVAEKRPAGFLFAQAGPFLGSLGRTGARLPGGLGLAEVVQALTGEVVGWVPTGAPARGYAIIGVKDTAVARRLLDACADFTLEPWVTTRKLGDVCQTTLQPPDLAISIPLETRLEADGLALGFGAHAAKGDGGGDVPPFALELFDRPWAFASWGRGIFASVLPDILLATPGASPSIMRGVLGVLGKLTELGLAVGWDADGYVAVLRVETTFANPDDVVAALDPLIERAAGGDRSAVAEIQALAQKHPDTPLGAAMRGGSPLAIAAAAIVPGIVMSLIHLAR